MYIGETSRSPFDRGQEHQEMIDNGDLAHPVVRHAWEEHRGVKPSIIMCVISSHKNPLKRLTQESVLIVDLSRGPEETDLNAKSEWGQARVPTIQVTIPNQKRTMEASSPELSNPYLAQYNKTLAAHQFRHERLDPDSQGRQRKMTQKPL